MSVALNAFSEIETQYSVDLTGKIISEPYTNPNTGRIISKFRIDTIDGSDSNLVVRLYLRGDSETLSALKYGQKLSLNGHIWQCDPVTNPYEFDFAQYLRLNGMGAYATAKIEDALILDTEKDLKSYFIDIRHAVAKRIDRLFPENNEIIRALILGDRSLISEETRVAFNETGVSHLIAISGLHVSTLAMIISALFGLFLSRNKSTVITLSLLLFYGGLIGFSASFLRALVMFAIFSFAPIVGYPSDGITRLCAALLVILLFAPMSILDAGFVLSFSAAAGIILLSPPLYKLFGLDSRLHLKPLPNPFLQALRNGALYFPKLLCVSLSAQLATFPAVIAYFGVQSIIAIPFNLVCVPLCMVGYPLALVIMGISVISMPIAVFLSKAPEFLFSFLISITKWGAEFPITNIRIGRYPTLLVLLHSAIILSASNMSRIRENIRRFLPLMLIIVAGLASLNTFCSSLGFSVTFLDADQADCAVIRTEGHTYLMDTGDTYTPAADYLSATCLRLDGIFLSHPHQDHAGGLEDVLSTLKPRVIYVPTGWFKQDNVAQAIKSGLALAESMNIEIIEISAGDEIYLSKNTKLRVYSPAADSIPSESNDLSLLATVEHMDKSILFTGDLSIKGEPENIPDIDILKVAHHGSNKATSSAFLESANPEIAIISVGDNNFNHPSDETLQKLQKAGARTLRTDLAGAITLRLIHDSWQVETYLSQEEYNDME